MLKLGQVVISRAGRDKGRFLIVVGFIDNDSVLLADGSLRKIERPKRKNIKHVAKTNAIAEGIFPQLNERTGAANAAIRAYLNQFDEKKQTHPNKESDIH